MVNLHHHGVASSLCSIHPADAGCLQAGVQPSHTESCIALMAGHSYANSLVTVWHQCSRSTCGHFLGVPGPQFAGSYHGAVGAAGLFITEHRHAGEQVTAGWGYGLAAACRGCKKAAGVPAGKAQVLQQGGCPTAQLGKQAGVQM